MPAQSPTATTRSWSHLFESNVKQLVARRLPHGKAQAVDGVETSAQEAAQSELLPPGQPLVQPVREALVLGARAQLEESGAQAGHVDQGEHHQGDGGKGDVNDLDGHLVESALPCGDVGVQDVPCGVVQVEEEEQAQRAENWDAPGGKQMEGEVFDLQRRREEAHIDGDEAHSTTELHHRALGLAAVTAQVNLGTKDKHQDQVQDDVISSGWPNHI